MRISQWGKINIYLLTLLVCLFVGGCAAKNPTDHPISYVTEQGYRITKIPLPRPMMDLAVSDGVIWVVQGGPISIFHKVLMLDPTSYQILATIPLNMTGWHRLLVGQTAIWVNGASHITRIDRKTHLTKEIEAHWPNIVIRGEIIWAVDKNGKLLKIKENTGQLIDTEQLSEGRGFYEITSGEEAVWIYREGVILRIDPQTNKVVARIKLKQTPARSIMLHGEESVWICGFMKGGFMKESDETVITRIDTDINRVEAQVKIKSDNNWGGTCEIGEGSIWVTNRNDSIVHRIDTQSKQITSSFDVRYALPVGSSNCPGVPAAHFPSQILIGGGFVWFGAFGTNKLPCAGQYITKNDPRTNQMENMFIPRTFQFDLLQITDDGVIWAGQNNVLLRIDI